MRNLAWTVLAAALTASCLHHADPADRAPQPVNGTAAVSRSNAPPPPASGLVAGAPPAPPAPEPPPRLLPGSRVGTVRAVGTGSRFVLLETVSAGIAPGIADGQELRCIHADAANAGGPFAVVRVSRERRAPFIVADVLSGQPQAGDDVYAVKVSGAAPFPVSAPTPSAASFLIPAAALPPAASAASPAPR